MLMIILKYCTDDAHIDLCQNDHTDIHLDHTLPLSRDESSDLEIPRPQVRGSIPNGGKGVERP